MRTDRLVLGLLAAVTLALALPSEGQQLTGSIEGRVTDSSGGVLPGVGFELVNVATQIALSRTTSAEGQYVFTSIKPGEYTLKAALDGFKTLSRRLTIEVNKSARLDLSLELGGLTEVVEVTAETPIVDISSAQVATNIEARVVTELPGINRDITTLVELMPGARQVQGTTSGFLICFVIVLTCRDVPRIRLTWRAKRVPGHGSWTLRRRTSAQRAGQPGDA